MALDERLIDAIKYDNVAIFIEFLKVRDNIVIDENIVFYCCKENLWNICEYIIGNFKINLDSVDELGNTFLIYAFMSNKIEFATMLLDYGFKNISKRNNEGYNCMNYIYDTSKLNHLLIQRILIKDKKNDNDDKFVVYDASIMENQTNSIIVHGGFGKISFDHKNNFMIKESLSNREGISIDLLKEALFLRIINSINSKMAVQLKGICIKDNKINLILEHLEYNLYNVFEIYRNIDINSKRMYFKIIYKTLFEIIDKLNNMGFIHRDLKPENIMIDEYGNIRLIDFGLCEFLGVGSKKFTSLVGTHEYNSPDNGYINLLRTNNSQSKLNNQRENYTSDIFSLGVLIIYSLLHKEISLFEDSGKIYQFTHNRKHKNGVYFCDMTPVLQQDLNIINSFSPYLLDLLLCMFDCNSSTRYSAKDCLKHKFFADITDNNGKISDEYIHNKKISITDNDFYSCEDIILKRHELKYGEEIYDFYMDCKIPKTNVNADELREIYYKRGEFLHKYNDDIFNTNICLTSISTDILDDVFDIFYNDNQINRKIDTSIDAIVKLLNFNYIPISIKSIVEFYTVKLREMNIITSTVILINSLLYETFFNLSLSIRDEDITVRDIMNKTIGEISVEYNLIIPFI